MSANTDVYVSPCSLTWGGSASFSGISGMSATATFNSTGSNLRINAKTSCQGSGYNSSYFTVVEITQFQPKASNFPKYVGDSISKSDFDITTSPSGYESSVNVTGLTTAYPGERTAYATLFGHSEQTSYTVVAITQFEAKSSSFPKYVGDSISASDFDITTGPSGYEGSVNVTGLSTAYPGYRTATATLAGHSEQASYTVVLISQFEAKASSFPKYVNQSISANDFDITTGPTGFEGSVEVGNLSTAYPGNRTASAILAGHSEFAGYTVVGIDEVINNTGESYVGGSVLLEARPDPCEATFPLSKPDWELISWPTGGENATVSPSSGSPTATLSNLTIPGTYTIRATCGNTDDIVEAVVGPNLYRIVRRGTHDEGPIQVPLEDPAYLKAEPSPEDASFLHDPEWWIDPLPPEGSSPSLSSDYDEATLTGLSVPGDYVVGAGYYNVDYITVTAVGVDPEILDGNGQGYSAYVCVGDNITLEAKPDPSYAPFPQNRPTWSLFEKPAGADNASLSNTSGSSTTTLTGHDIEGDYFISASCGNNTNFVVKAVKVDEIIRNEPPYESGTIYVPVGTDIPLRANIAPAGYQFPQNKPAWSIQNYPSEATPSLSHYSGSTTTLSGLTKPGTYEIKATTCGSDASITVIAVQVCLQEDHSSILAYTGDQYDNAPTKGYIACGFPVDGTFLWECSTSNRGLLEIDSGQNTNTVDVKGYTSSATENDAVITVTYTLGGCSVQDSDTITVIRPVSTGLYYGYYDFNNYTSRNVYHPVYHQFNQPINIIGIPTKEYVLYIYGIEETVTSPGDPAYYPRAKPDMGPYYQYANWDGGIAIEDIIGGSVHNNPGSKYYQELKIGGWMTSPSYDIYIQLQQQDPFPNLWKQ